jgi:hypothetical protein
MRMLHIINIYGVSIVLHAENILCKSGLIGLKYLQTLCMLNMNG